MTTYPEHEKMAEVKEDSQRLGAFIEWLKQQGYVLCRWEEIDHYRVRKSSTMEDETTEGEVFTHRDELTPVHKSINEWLADFYDIDLKKINDEKEQMLAEIRERVGVR